MNALLFTVIIIEGYVVLAAELLAMRQVVPVAGSGTDVISIVIAAVLMPLAFGYYAGGHYRSRKKNGETIRQKLIANILKAAFIFCLGLSYYIIEIFFQAISSMGVGNRLVQVSIYCMTFIVYPVFLLGQTIPLISNYFPSSKLSKITGKMLCFSTLGSFLGSVFSTVILMAMVGVHNTVIVVISLMVFLVFLLARKKMSDAVFMAAFILIITVTLNSPAMMKSLFIVEDNQYNTIKVADAEDGSHVLSLNGNYSSAYHEEEGVVLAYAKFIEKHFLAPIIKGDMPPKDVLIIGAGGFTLGVDDTHNNYVFVDIDKSLKEISEKHILKQKLKENKIFEPVPARGFFYNNKKKFDLIILDAYSGIMTIPEHLVTKEYFKQVRGALKENGRLVSNFILCPHFSDKLSLKVDNTFRSVFPHVNRNIIVFNDNYNAWENYERENLPCAANILYTYFNTGDFSDAIYTDDKNSSFLDK